MKELLISGVPLFAAIPPDELAQLATELEQVALPSGALLMREGATGDGMYIVLAGTFEIIKQLDTPDERLFGRRGAGEVVGELGLLNCDGCAPPARARPLMSRRRTSSSRAPTPISKRRNPS